MGVACRIDGDGLFLVCFIKNVQPHLINEDSQGTIEKSFCTLACDLVEGFFVVAKSRICYLAFIMNQN